MVETTATLIVKSGSSNCPSLKKAPMPAATKISSVKTVNVRLRIASSGRLMTRPRLPVLDSDSLAGAETVNTSRNDEIAGRQPLLDVDAANNRLAHFNLPARHGLGSVIHNPDETACGIVRREDRRQGDYRAFEALGNLRPWAGADTPGHARNNRDARWRGDQKLDGVGSRRLGGLFSDLGNLGGNFDVRKRIKCNLDVHGIRHERDQRLRHVDDHLDLLGVDNAHDRLLRLELFKYLGKNGTDDSSKGSMQHRISEIELAPLQRGFQRPYLCKCLLGVCLGR